MAWPERHSGVMAWEFTEDVAVYIERVWSLLAAHPVDHTLALTVIKAVRDGQRWCDEPMGWGWYGEGPEVSGAVLRTPPYELLLAVVPEGSLEELVATLRARQVGVPGVYGDTDLVECFARRWIAGTSLHIVAGMHQRLYALTTLHPRHRRPPAALAWQGATISIWRWVGSSRFTKRSGVGSWIWSTP